MRHRVIASTLLMVFARAISSRLAKVGSCTSNAAADCVNR